MGQCYTSSYGPAIFKSFTAQLPYWLTGCKATWQERKEIPATRSSFPCPSAHVLIVLELKGVPEVACEFSHLTYEHNEVHTHRLGDLALMIQLSFGNGLPIVISYMSLQWIPTASPRKSICGPEDFILKIFPEISGDLSWGMVEGATISI